MGFLVLERAIRDSRVETSGIIFYKSTQTLACADDINIIDLRLSYVAEAYQGIEQAAENLGLQINEAKTKLMVAASATLPTTNLNLRNRDVQISKVSNSNSIVVDAGCQPVFHLLSEKSVRLKEPVATDEAYILPVLTYASV